MPVYVFKWSDDEEPTHVDLSDDDAAWSEAVITLGLVLRDIDGSLPAPSDLGLSVEDQSGRVVATMNVHAERGGSPRDRAIVTADERVETTPLPNAPDPNHLLSSGSS